MVTARSSDCSSIEDNHALCCPTVAHAQLLAFAAVAGTDLFSPSGSYYRTDLLTVQPLFVSPGDLIFGATNEMTVR